MILSFIFLSFLLISCNKAEEPITEHEMPMEKLWGYKDLERFDNYRNLQSFYRKIDTYYSKANTSTENYHTYTITKTGDFPQGDYGSIKGQNYTSFALTKFEAAAVVKIYSLDHPAYYWISDDIMINDSDVDLTLEGSYSKYEARKNVKDKIDKYTSTLKAKITDDFSQYDIIKTIHDYILDTAVYDNNKSFEAYNIAGIMVDGKGVCEAYAKTFQYLAYQFDIECILAVGTAKTSPTYTGSHAWNLVKLDGKWYGVDTTFDDSLNTREDFLLTSEDMLDNYFPSSDNSLDDAEYFTYILPEVSADKYSCE